MNRAEFIEATRKLENYYDKEYTTEQNKIMFEALQQLTVERYRTVINKCIQSSKFLPKVADIFEINRQVTIAKKEELPKKEVPCKICNKVGLIIWQKKWNDRFYSQGARCICENAKKYMDYPSIVELGLYRDGELLGAKNGI